MSPDTTIGVYDFEQELRDAQIDGTQKAVLSHSKTDYISSGLTRDEISLFKLVPAKAIMHLNRMIQLDRSPQEREFAITFARHWPKRVNKWANLTINDEGSDTCIWWTLSPYVYELLKKQFDENVAFTLLLKWAKNGRSAADDTSTQKHTETVHLKGLERYNHQFRDPGFTLGPNPNGASHKLAKKEAQRLIQEGIFTKLK